MSVRFHALCLIVALPAAAQGPILSGCSVFPSNNVWNTPIDKLPLDRNSAAYVATIGATRTAHADFGSGLWDGGPIGIPYVTVPGSQAKVAVTFDYDEDSDHGGYPIPPSPPVEGGNASTGDRHVLIVDRDACILYELYSAYPNSDGSWHAGSGAIFDLKANALRPAGFTSADAAGLPILAGLVRYDEVAAGEIRHAIRFTAPQTRNAYIWPARHYASDRTGTQYPPMGQRFRLQAGFDISGFPAQSQVVLRALKKYGMILADNGSSWYLSGAPDDRWDNDDLHGLGQLRGSDFEAVDESSLMTDPNSAGAATAAIPSAPVLQSLVNGASFLAGPVAPGEIVTLFGKGFGSDAGSTHVWFNQTAAPLLYVHDNQINAVAPYEIASLTGVQVHVDLNGNSSNSVTAPVAAAAPGIFVVLNQNFTVNTISNPAKPGSAVILYATGEGQTIPQGQDGKIAGNSAGVLLPQPVLGAKVRIGSQTAEVLYAGAAPGFIAGAMQVNALVPATLPAGTLQPLVIEVGGFSSQASVMVAIGR